MSIICLDNVVFAYSAQRILNGVTFELHGGAVGLLGPNGAGKSTMLKMLLGFLRPLKGSVTVFDLEQPSNALRVRQRLGYMPEREVTSPKISAVSFLTYCGGLYGMSRVDSMERAHEVLNYVGMGENRYRKMETYSTGMLQRVKFAQALIHDPKLLLLDEPTNGLDPEGRVEMLKLIKELAEERHVTVFLSSHLLPDIESTCDQIVMIDKGRVICQGRIDELTEKRENLFEVRVRDNKEQFLSTLVGLGCTWSENQHGNLMITKPDSIGERAFFETALSVQTQVRHMKPVRRSLEEVFMSALGRHGGVLTGGDGECPSTN